MTTAPMNADRVINGSYGSLHVVQSSGSTTLAPEYLAQVRSVTARIAINRQEIVPVGDSWTRYKKTNYTGDGSFVLWKATSKFIKLMEEAVNTKSVPRLALNIVLEDPESLGVEEIQLNDVKIWEVPMGFDAGELIEETIQFTFEGFIVVKKITGDVWT